MRKLLRQFKDRLSQEQNKDQKNHFSGHILLVKMVKYQQLHEIQSNVKDKENLTTWLPLCSVFSVLQNVFQIIECRINVVNTETRSMINRKQKEGQVLHIQGQTDPNAKWRRCKFLHAQNCPWLVGHGTKPKLDIYKGQACG